MQYPLWEQGVLSSNLSAPTIQIQLVTELFPKEKFASVASVGGAFPLTLHPNFDSGTGGRHLFYLMGSVILIFRPTA